MHYDLRANEIRARWFPGTRYPAIVDLTHRAKYTERQHPRTDAFFVALHCPLVSCCSMTPSLDRTFHQELSKNLFEGTVFKMLDLVRAQIVGLKTEGFLLAEIIKSDDIWDPSSEKRL